jgi:hypothetical protein
VDYHSQTWVVVVMVVVVDVEMLFGVDTVGMWLLGYGKGGMVV